MYGALVMGTLRGIHKTGTDTARVLSLLNERLAQSPLQGRFCSNPETLELTSSNAGIPLPLLVSGSTCRSLGEGGLPSGLFPGAAYSAHVVRLTPGDSVLFATDGLYEWQNRDGIEFGDEQIGEVWLQCQGKSAGDSIDHMFESIREFSQGDGAHDDTRAVVLRVRE
jgi:sigma-B regulation protein RsbU (phosphoserine phosphatase)